MQKTCLRNIVVALVVVISSPAIAEGPSPEQARGQGARWLVEHQNTDGGWGAGALGSDARGAPSDVATTSLAVMALLRDAKGGSSHRQSVLRGVAFVAETVASSPAEGARLQGQQGTQPQHKLGRNVDTHFAALMLGEASKQQIALDDPSILPRAYDKVLTKVVAAQKADGSFDNDGWAPILSSSVAAQSLFRAKGLGKKIAPAVLERSNDYQRRLVDTETGSFDASSGAGVDLYAAASSLINNSEAAKQQGGPARDQAKRAAKATADAVRSRGDALISGFGSVGGEEMLSYMMISDTMAEQGGDDWDGWNRKIGKQLTATQNADGSWSGHHCITSTTFVTAAAVMTLGSEHSVAGHAALQ